MPQNYNVLNCKCGHVGMITVANLIEFYGKAYYDLLELHFFIPV